MPLKGEVSNQQGVLMSPRSFKPSPTRRFRLLPVLDSMLALELTKTLLAVLTVLVTIIVSRKFLNILTKAIEGEIAGETLLTLLGLKVLSAFIMLLPAAEFLAILMVFGRMYRDQEMAVLASGGAGFARLYRAIAWFLIPLTIAATWLALDVIPWSESKVQALVKKDEKTADLRGIKPGRFNEFSQGDVVLYAENLSEQDGVMKNIFVQSRSGNQNGVTVAATGYLQETETGSHFVVLEKGTRYQGTPGQADYVISEFDQYAVKIDQDGDTGENGFKREASMSSFQLWLSSSPRELAELQRRLAVPLGVLLLGILAVPISRVAPRSGVYGNVLTAFLIYVIYFNLQNISQGLLIKGKAPWWLAYSGVYIILLMLTLIYLLRETGMRWCWQVITGRAVR
jgi:lipopolysaccharide export system permease protein